MVAKVALLLLLPAAGVAAELSVKVNPRYESAYKNAQEAFLIQSGIEANVKLAAKQVGSKLDLAARKVINSCAPLKHQHVYFIVGAAWSIKRSGGISQEFDDPFVNVKHRLTVRPEQLMLTSTLNF